MHRSRGLGENQGNRIETVNENDPHVRREVVVVAMHPMSMKSMEMALSFVCGRLPEGGSGTVLDVGSFDVNGTYRPIVDAVGLRYVGVDIVPGPNVDVVSSSPKDLPFDDGDFDVVISGQMLEHCEFPQEIVCEMRRVLRDGGWLIINTHHSFPEHRFPKDYWRFMKDGLELLLHNAGEWSHIDVHYIDDRDIQAIAQKGGAR